MVWVSVKPIGDADPLSGAVAARQQLAREPLGLVDIGKGDTPASADGTDAAPAVIDGDRAEEIALDKDGVPARDIALWIAGLKADGISHGNGAGGRHGGRFHERGRRVQRVI